MNIIVIDDHPMTIEGFTRVLGNDFLPVTELNVNTVLDLESAYNLIIKSHSTKNSFDIAIIDYTLSPFVAKNMNNGADMANFIRKKMPKCKIIIITAHTEVLLVYDIYKKAAPDGLIIKNDVTPLVLKIAVESVLRRKEYFSPMAFKCVSEILKENLMKDDLNRQLITFLAKGYKPKELESVLFLSKSAIEKRIYKLKKIFSVSDDSGLIKEVYRLGYI